MSLACGIVGLPNVGKSSLFNALTRAQAEVGIFPFTTIASNVGVAEISDQRFSELIAVLKPEKVVPAHVKFIDIAGLVKGANRGEGLGNQFLGYIREVDALLHIVRCFQEENVPHVSEKINPASDIETVNLELALADLATVEKRRAKVDRQTKSGERKYLREQEFLGKVAVSLDQGLPVRRLELKGEEKRFLSELNLLTAKPVVYVSNIAEEDIGEKDNVYISQVKEIAQQEGAEVVAVSAKIEAEVAELGKEEARDFLKDLGIENSGLDQLVNASYRLLGLITFFTVESGYCQAWTVPKGTKAPQAAGVIHSDMERGFIKAEVVNWKDLVKAGSFHQAREEGHLLLEGREYEVREGDVIMFKFAT